MDKETAKRNKGNVVISLPDLDIHYLSLTKNKIRILNTY